MLEPLYIAGNSRLHRLPAGLKLLALCAAGRAVRAARSALAGPGVGRGRRVGLVQRRRGCAALAPIARPGVGSAGAGLFTGFFQGGVEALAVLLRVGAMGLALAVTLTTRTADLIAVCEWALLPLQRLGLLDAGKVALALALALRFVPEIWRNFHEIREAQARAGSAPIPWR